MRKTRRIDHIPLIVRFFILLVIVLLKTTGAQASDPGSGSIKEQGDFDAQYQQALRANPEGVTFNIRFDENKTRFGQGEIIKISLEFSSRRPDAYFISNRSNDRSGRLGIDVYHIDPQEGAVDPLYDYFHGPPWVFSIGGPSSNSVVKETPFVIMRELNEWWRFDRPGKYRLYVTSSRVGRKVDDDLYSSNNPWLTVTSNIVEFEILPDDPEWSERMLREAAKTLDSSSDNEAACRTLRFLSTRAAVREMVRRYSSDNNRCSYEYGFGLIGSPHRSLAVTEMEKSLTAPDHPVSSSFLYTLSRLSLLLQNPGPFPSYSSEDQEQAKIRQEIFQRAQDSFQQLRIHYMRHLAASIQGKRGKARAVSLNTLMESIKSLPVEKRPDDLTATLENIPGALSDVILDLPPDAQYNLLASRWKQIAGADLLPALRRIYENAPPNPHMSGLLIADMALHRIYELAPDEGRRLIIKEIRSPRPRVGIKVLALLPDETLPDLDDVLAENLERGEDVWTFSGLVQRYASPAVFSRIKAFYEDKAGRWACDIQSSLLAYFLRVDPGQGAEMVSHALAAREHTKCYTSALPAIARLYVYPELERMAIAALSDPDEEVVANAASVLGRYGSAAAEEPLWRRFEQWHEEWQQKNGPDGKTSESDSPATNNPQSRSLVEGALIVALSQATGWLTDLEKLKKIQALCLTEIQRQSVEDKMRLWNHTILISFSSNEDSPLGISLAQYVFTSVPALQKKLLQFPPGTVFIWSQYNPVGKEAERVFEDIESFLEERNMKIQKEKKQ